MSTEAEKRPDFLGYFATPCRTHPTGTAEHTLLAGDIDHRAIQLCQVVEPIGTVQENLMNAR